MTLYILNQHAFHHAGFQELSAMTPEDHLLLIEEAVTAALTTTADEKWQSLMCQTSVLYEDLLSRGLADKIDNGCLNGFQVIGMRDFVVLTAKHNRVVTWP
ncbi:sulfurtransferase complex subunit TusB [Vreelandella aquamarina]|uniref:sulfurtransferase complex subunit TusB n=1 Tax=Vreelandella aquamarina TaxID=77097 RepID=UPI00384B4DF7